MSCVIELLRFIVQHSPPLLYYSLKLVYIDRNITCQIHLCQQTIITFIITHVRIYSSIYSNTQNSWIPVSTYAWRTCSNSLYCILTYTTDKGVASPGMQLFPLVIEKFHLSSYVARSWLSPRPLACINSVRIHFTVGVDWACSILHLFNVISTCVLTYKLNGLFVMQRMNPSLTLINL